MWVSTFRVVGFFYCNNGYIIPFSPGDFWFIFSRQMPNVRGLCSHGAEHQGILIKLVIYEFRKDPYSVGNICVIPDRPTCWAWLVLFKAPILAVPVSRWITAGNAVPTWLREKLKLFSSICSNQRVLRWCCAIWELQRLWCQYIHIFFYNLLTLM